MPETKKQLQVFTRDQWWDVTDIKLDENGGFLAVHYTNGFLYVGDCGSLRFVLKESN